MKVVSVSMIKNEADIVESFVRHTLNYVDEMIILDHFSSDGTGEILQALKEEGLPISIKHTDITAYEQAKFTSEMLQEAVLDYSADIVVPIDADEFIMPTDPQKGNFLRRLDRNKVYRIANVITTPCSYKEDEFLLGGDNLQNDKPQIMKKIVVGAGVYEIYNIGIVIGNHDISVKHKFKDNIIYQEISDGYYAHYQIRSKQQFVSKVANGWLTATALPNRGKTADHWHKAFDIIKTRDITDEDIKHYLLESGELNLERKVVFVGIKNEKIKYHNLINMDPFRSVLKNTESLVDDMAKKRIDTKKPKELIKYAIKELIFRRNKYLYR